MADNDTGRVLRPLIPDNVRNWLYPVSLAVLALVGGYGLVDEAQIPLWIGLVSAVLGLGTATIYRPDKTVKPLKRAAAPPLPGE